MKKETRIERINSSRAFAEYPSQDLNQGTWESDPLCTNYLLYNFLFRIWLCLKHLVNVLLFDTKFFETSMNFYLN